MARVQRNFVGRLRCTGEQDHHASAAAGFAFEVDESAIGRNDAADGGQSQAGALASILGSEEWLEEALAGFGVHAVTVVADYEQDTTEMQLGCLKLFRRRDGNCSCWSRR